MTSSNPARFNSAVFNNIADDHRDYSTTNLKYVVKNVYQGGGDSNSPLDRLLQHTAPGALHNSAERGPDAPKCHPETRIAVQEQIMSWIKHGNEDDDPKSILWLSGHAGSGKTAIAGTIADECDREGLLAASFFFSSTSASRDRSSKRPFILTLVYGLLQQQAIVGLKEVILSIIQDDPAVLHKHLDQQLDQLVLCPLRTLAGGKDRRGWPKVIIVDGVDECRGEQGSDASPSEARRSREDNHKEIVSILTRASADSSFPFRILIASRPDPVIRHLFNTSPNPVMQLFLDDKYDPNSDIALFVNAKLSAIQRTHNLPNTWAPKDAIDLLVKRASGQFIYAATALIEDASRPPQEQLQRVLQWCGAEDSEPGPFSSLDALYTGILESSPNPRLASKWLVITTLPYLSMNWYLRAFLESFPGETNYVLGRLSSLIKVTNGNKRFHIHFYHRSFLDFLGDASRSGSLYVLKNRGPQGVLRNIDIGDFFEKFHFWLPYFTNPTRSYEASDVSWWLQHTATLQEHRKYTFVVTMFVEIDRTAAAIKNCNRALPGYALLFVLTGTEYSAETDGEDCAPSASSPVPIPVLRVASDVLLTPFRMASSSSSHQGNPFSSASSSESRDSQYVDYPRHQRTDSTNSRGTPSTPQASEDSRLIQSPPSPVNGDFGQRTVRSSPLNPTSPYVRPHLPSSTASSSRPVSRSSSNHPFVNSRQDAPLRSNAMPMGEGPRGSMILYRLADDPATVKDTLLPPRLAYAAGARDSVISSSGDSITSLADSKYPSGIPGGTHLRGLVPYAYEPEVDDGGPPDEEDYLHDPKEEGGFRGDKGHFPWRGVVNISVLIILMLALLALFVVYPVFTYYRDAERNRLIDGNIRINATGQAPVLFQMPEPIDPDTPKEAHSRTGFDGNEYQLVFSDEFNIDGRTFYPGDDPFWEAVDLWYGVTGDVEWYDPANVITKDGALILTIDSVATTQAGLSRGSTAPFTREENHDLEYRSGMVQTWNKFCFTNGYIEVSVTFPGPDENTAGYWPGAWTMGNLARPGYTASTDGMWPYTYDSCDVGTFPNQTLRDGSGPAAALHSDKSRDRYNNELSWLTGQRTSACSCPDSEHPGPSHNIGRGAPEIDIFEASKDKQATTGGTVSQSAQFAPFAHDYAYYNDTEDKWKNFDPARTRANSFLGSAVQQSVSGVTRVPSDMFQGSGQRFTTFGFEYHGHPKSRDQGYVQWQVDGSPTHRVGAGAVAADPLVEIGPRLIPEEPMAIILNLGMSPNWQDIDLSTMTFPGEMLIDYVRVYQRKDEINIGCDPPDYPTKKYIDDHLDAYTDVNMTVWKWPMPKNELWEGGC